MSGEMDGIYSGTIFRSLGRVTNLEGLLGRIIRREVKQVSLPPGLVQCKESGNHTATSCPLERPSLGVKCAKCTVRVSLILSPCPLKMSLLILTYIFLCACLNHCACSNAVRRKSNRPFFSTRNPENTAETTVRDVYLLQKSDVVALTNFCCSAYCSTICCSPRAAQCSREISRAGNTFNETTSLYAGILNNT
jgi:hypothetical protein